MKWNLAGLSGLLVVSLVELHAAPADACGVKLTIKTSTPRKAIARSSNPSHLLLVGTPPHRLERELSDAGHDVEVVPSPGAAKRKQYAVVVVDASHADEARTTFTGAVVVVRSGDVSSDIASVEKQVSRPVLRSGGEDARIALRAKENRQPIQAGGGDAKPARKMVASKETGGDTTAPTMTEQVKPVVAPPTPVKPLPTPPPAKPTPAVVTTVPPVQETAPPPIDKKPTVVAKATFNGSEVYFNLSSASVGNKASLARAIRWLTDNPSAHVVIEGYADPTGSPQLNMTLSQSRAESVRDLLGTAGIDQSRMEVTAYGDTRLKYGRADSRNRRVAIQPKP